MVRTILQRVTVAEPIRYKPQMLTLLAGFVLQQSQEFEPTSSYSKLDIEGFTVRVSREANADPQSLDPAIALLRLRFNEIVRVVPPEALKTLRKISVWVELDDKKVLCACYHGDVGWLKENGFNPEKENSIEIGNIKNFVNWSYDQPLMLLHEMAHGYHDLTYGFEGKEVKETYQAAMAAKLYEEGTYYKGQKKKAYAATNQMEYFAELSEAFFGYNDFYPFTKPELKQHDPKGYEMVARAWGVNP